jgi:hypothetical protein
VDIQLFAIKGLLQYVTHLDLSQRYENCEDNKLLQSNKHYNVENRENTGLRARYTGGWIRRII